MMPIWLRLILVVALISMVWASQRAPESPHPSAPQSVPQSTPKSVSVEIVGQDGQPVETQAAEPLPAVVKTKPPQKQPQNPPPEPRAQPPVVKSAPQPKAKHQAKHVIRSVTLKDQSGRVIYKGDIDLTPTLDRIAAGERLRFPNDGSTFQNRERRLPKQPAGYYREYVVPTPDENGPGPQRLVIGKDGEIFYTHDHYRTFQRIP